MTGPVDQPQHYAPTGSTLHPHKWVLGAGDALIDSGPDPLALIHGRRERSCPTP